MTERLSPGQVTGEHIVRVVMHGAMFPRFREWLEAQGFILASAAPRDGELPTFLIGVGDELVQTREEHM